MSQPIERRSLGHRRQDFSEAAIRRMIDRREKENMSDVDNARAAGCSVHVLTRLIGKKSEPVAVGI